MRVKVRVTPRARTRSIEAAVDGSLRVKLLEPATDGRANAALIKLLAEHFVVPRRAVRLVQGRASRQKVLEINL